jgi:hypothetical protein
MMASLPMIFDVNYLPDGMSYLAMSPTGGGGGFDTVDTCPMGSVYRDGYCFDGGNPQVNDVPLGTSGIKCTTGYHPDLTNTQCLINTTPVVTSTISPVTGVTTISTATPIVTPVTVPNYMLYIGVGLAVFFLLKS